MIVDIETGAAVVVVSSPKYGEFRVLVDVEDWVRVSSIRWTTTVKKRDRSVYFLSNKPRASMHRVIMGATGKDIVDHKDNNYLDLRKQSLQIVSHQHNCQKQRTRHRGKRHSQYRGVSWLKANQKWRAYINIDKKPTHIGLFGSELSAALAFDARARELNQQGNHYALNFPREGEYAA